MVRVFVYVTGIALTQFSSKPGDPAIVVVANGKHTFHEVSVPHPHTVTVAQGQIEVTEGSTGLKVVKPNEVPFASDRPPVVAFTAGCGGKTCPAILPPSDLKIANLNEILRTPGIGIDDACDEPAEAKGCGMINAYLSFRGPWHVVATVDCYRGYPAVKPKLPELNFVRPRESWSVRYTDKAREIGNSIVFYADVEESELATLMKVNDDSVALQVFVSSEEDPFCDEMYGSPAKCAAIAVRNHADSTAYLGGADPHFLPIYSLLDTDVTEVWLPITLDHPKTFCTGGYGCCGYPGCDNGYVVVAP